MDLYPKLLIFDFDGVVADSETLACGIAAAYASELGAPMSAADGLSVFKGKQVKDVEAIVSDRGGVVPRDFASELEKRTLRGFATNLESVPGVQRFLDDFATVPRCLASSSSHTRLRASLERIRLTAYFAGCIFSAEDVSRGKPFPDLFLFAADSMHQSPSDSLVIEDSVGGVSAAVAAGMTVVGLLAATHMRNDTGESLLEAGASVVVRSYEELAHWLRGS